ncbi:GIY-YIG nuclease family protein [Clostridium butyricum]|mgnify:FL=1|uniref:GIY-YIG nuclease family protein n=1 Tax=Clostridium butyricum TaxID=1492 RepID=UPI0018A92183|nr:GIY-YIG nuclease family protein [Clostridium butyricum]MCQ2014593.1 GIY-YIG nuclease family protein [Clostridium butyricum]MCQ2023975.1 GIY-YIG nuclease family protein [Clostridium butyricum]MDU1339283.1 GIY-YIG nuclease family protein [Clostridium butyricum]
MNYVYIVECSDGTLYTGWTNNLDKRIEQHCNGTGAKYTRGRGPVRLVYHEEFNDKRDAMRREYEIKRYSRINKLKLIEKMQKYDKK